MEVTLLGMIGNTVLGKAISEAASVCKSVYDTHCSGSAGSQVRRMLDELDVQAQLEAAGSLVCTLSRAHDFEAHETGSLLCAQVREAIDRLQADLLAISEESRQHSGRWFASWRYADYDPLIKRLAKDQKLLATRLDRLVSMTPLLENRAKESQVIHLPAPPPVPTTATDEIDKLIAELTALQK
jgi:hypothetical protein